VWGSIFNIYSLSNLEIHTTSLLTVVSMLCDRSQKLFPMSTWNSTLWPASPASPLPQTLVITFALSASVCSASVHSTYRWGGLSFCVCLLQSASCPLGLCGCSKWSTANPESTEEHFSRMDVTLTFVFFQHFKVVLFHLLPSVVLLKARLHSSSL
jgi:hypothetical protein